MTTPPEQPQPFDPRNPDPNAPGTGDQPAFGQPALGQPAYGQPAGGYGQPGPGFTPQGQPAWGVGPNSPYGVDPQTGIPYSDKSRIIAGILQLLLGQFGAGRWYTGNYGMAVAQLLTCGGFFVWSFVDGIYMLVGSAKDPEGRPLRPGA